MLVAKAQRTELGQLGARTWTTERQKGFGPPTEDHCLLVWMASDSATIPDLIVVPDGQIENFLAWTTTYLPHLTPLTALVRVIEHRDSRAIIDPERAPPALDHSAIFLRGCLGIVQAEVVAAFRGVFAPANIGLTPYLSTLSWVALQARYLNLQKPLRQMRHAWEEARRLLDARALRYSQDVEDVWSFVNEVEPSSRSESNREPRRIKTPFGSTTAGAAWIDSLDVAREHRAELDALNTGPLEGRVEVFRTLLQALYRPAEAPPMNALLAGYALSQISQGSFSHIALLGPDRVPDVRPLLWYGWFDFIRAGLESDSPALSAPTLQLQWRIAQLTHPSRRGDIALDELRVLARSKDAFAECLLDIRHPIAVELFPGALSIVQPSIRIQHGAARVHSSQRSLFESDV